MTPKQTTIQLQTRRNIGGQQFAMALVCLSLGLSFQLPIRGEDLGSNGGPSSNAAASEFQIDNLPIGGETDLGMPESVRLPQGLFGSLAKHTWDDIFGSGDLLTSDKPLFELRGRIETDVVFASQSPANEAIFGDLPHAAGLRRARIGGQGHLTPDLRYVAEIDMANRNLAIRDLLVGWGDVRDRGEVRIGHFREPFSLEGGTSANSFAMQERSPINHLDPARNWGLGYYRCSPDEDSTIAVGVFHSGQGPSDLRGGPASDTAITAKWTALPWYEEDGPRLMHVGLASSARFPDNGLVMINQSPRSPLLSLGDSSASPFVPQIRIHSRYQQLFNAQWAFVDGPFSAQAEWYGTFIESTIGQPVFYQGSYLNLGYFLTGEHRSYQTQSGVFGAVTVDQPFLRGFSSKHDTRQLGMGAWELTSQFGYLDFTDTNTPRGPQGQLVGVQLPQVTFGVNWYLADRLRIMFNYSHASPIEPNAGSSNANVFSSRLALYW